MARLHYLMERYRTHACTRAEMEELFQRIRQEDESGLLPGLHLQWEKARKMAPADPENWDLLFQSMLRESRELEAAEGAPVSREAGLEPVDEDSPSVPGRRRSRVRRRWLLASLCFLLLLGGSGIVLRLLSVRQAASPRALPMARKFKNDVQPGGNKAILTLADGSSIVLDSATDGTLSVQGNTRVLKVAGGRLAYQPARGAAADPVYNTISTPKGGQYQIELPDGSKVWLDAGSSLRFPTTFRGKDREVQLSGEAYFEVAGNPLRPFAVSVFSHEPGKSEELQKVVVLGTQFNVMAYADESQVKTTLLEGAVRINGFREKILKPGEQALLTRDHASGLQVIDDADVDAAVAWKNGYFDFNKADIQAIMRQLSRWYDVEVSFRGNGSKDRVFFGGIQRNLPLSSIFNILERSGVQFSIDGKKVVVDL